MAVEFEWIDEASVENYARYGVRFTEAVHVFLDAKAIEFVDPRRGTLSLIGHVERGLLYVVFVETADGRIRLLHARLADPDATGAAPEFDFDPRRMKRVTRPDGHYATPADVAPHRCKVTVTWQIDAEVAAAFREERVSEVLREALPRQASGQPMVRDLPRRGRSQLPV